MNAGAVGIIGGADGPTAIFVANRLSPWVITTGVLGIAALVGLAVWFLKSRR